MTETLGLGGLGALLSTGQWASKGDAPYIDATPTPAAGDQTLSQPGSKTLFSGFIEGLQSLTSYGLDTWGKVNTIEATRKAREMDVELTTQTSTLSRKNFKENNILGMFAIAAIIGVAAWAVLRK